MGASPNLESAGTIFVAPFTVVYDPVHDGTPSHLALAMEAQGDQVRIPRIEVTRQQALGQASPERITIEGLRNMLSPRGQQSPRRPLVRLFAPNIFAGGRLAQAAVAIVPPQCVAELPRNMRLVDVSEVSGSDPLQIPGREAILTRALQALRAKFDYRPSHLDSEERRQESAEILARLVLDPEHVTLPELNEIFNLVHSKEINRGNFDSQFCETVELGAALKPPFKQAGIRGSGKQRDVYRIEGPAPVKRRGRLARQPSAPEPV